MILFEDEVTHSDYAAMKEELGFSNRDIAEIAGLSVGTVKNQTRPSVKLATWAKTMAYMWKLNKIKEKERVEL